MTRETKIGLLVGLAFIIVVAILLTDHSTATNDDRPATVSDAGDSVRQSVATPPAPEPKKPVTTRADLKAARARAPIESKPSGDQGPLQVAQDASTQTQSDELPASPRTVPTTGRDPIGLVAQHPNDFVAAGEPGAAPRDAVADPRAASAAKPAPRSPVATPPVAPPKTYVAAEGDTVSRIASWAMGGNTIANREALIKANPSLQNEGNVVYIGKTYVIPSAGATAQASAAKPAEGKPAEQKPAFKPPAPPAANTVLYTVKENDNLWRIAAYELGDGNRWTQIKDLNRDVLKGGETVKPNMRIRLPKPGAATASAAD